MIEIKILTATLENYKNSVLKLSLEKPILLDFLNVSNTFCAR